MFVVFISFGGKIFPAAKDHSVSEKQVLKQNKQLNTELATLKTKLEAKEDEVTDLKVEIEGLNKQLSDVKAEESSAKNDANNNADNNQQVVEKPVTKPKKSTSTAKRHTLAPGETLTSLSLKFYGNRKNATKICAANRSVLSDCNNIVAGKTITIP
jgi:nucleoid-associated protein YgaU